MTGEHLSFEESEAVGDWRTVDDVVMGGRSDSTVGWSDEPWAEGENRRGVLRFEGEVSLENNGGFCSVRQEESDRGRPGVERLKVLLRGDGHRYKWTLRTRGTPSSSSWRIPFETTGQWQEVTLPLADFELWRRGRLLEAGAAPDPAKLTSVGLLISDKQEGDFRIDVARVVFEAG